MIPWICYINIKSEVCLGRHLAKLGNLDIDVILCIIWIQVVCKHTVHLEVDGKKKSSRPNKPLTGRVAQSVTCLTTDAHLTEEPGIPSWILTCSHTFVKIDSEIISMVILLPSAEAFRRCCCQLQAKLCAQITG